jgi:S1-C subfamily serine protease
VIGVNTAIYSPSGAYSGIGFAVPVDTVNDVVPQLIQYGQAERAALGVSLFEDAIARQLGVSRGAVVSQVVETGPASEAGVRPSYRDQYGDIHLEVITAVDGQPIRRAEDVAKALRQRKVGETVRVTLLRDGQEVVVSITLQALQRSLR